MIRLTTLDGHDAVFPVDIAYRPGETGTDVRWEGKIYVVKESHEEVSQRLLDYRDEQRKKTRYLKR